MKDDYDFTMIRRLRLRVGQTIQGREYWRNGQWSDARLTLVWRGTQVLVWQVWTRTSIDPAWLDRGEEARWTLRCRRWRKVPALARCRVRV